MAPTDELKPGLTGSASHTVETEHSAPHVGSGSVDVFATPMLVALMEAAAVAAVDPHLPDEFTSLGLHIDVKHIAPTPLGLTVTAVAELIEVTGRRLSFEIEARDDSGKIGTASHVRVIVDRARFDETLNAKRRG